MDIADAVPHGGTAPVIPRPRRFDGTHPDPDLHARVPGRRRHCPGEIAVDDMRVTSVNVGREEAIEHGSRTFRTGIRNRITSYNVCYTKLLRVAVHTLHDADAVGRQPALAAKA